MTENLTAEHEDLAALLGERPADIETSDLEAAPAAPEASDTALKLDRWNVRRGTQIAAEWAEYGTAEVDPLVAADAHGALFEQEPQVSANPKDRERAAWFKQLMETPEYRSLHAQTVWSDYAAIAAKGLCDEWSEYRAENPTDEAEPGGESESIGRSVARIRSAAQALATAQADLDTARDTAAGLGMGGGGGPLDRAALARYFKQVRDSDLLRKILAWAGRGRNLARSLQKQKTKATRGELTGIELGGDVARLLPVEQLQIAGAVPELELLAMHRLATRRSFCYRQRKNEPKKSGPIVVCVDESGSMNGDRIIAAKGLAMTMAWVAQAQNRWLALVGFSGGSEGNVLVLPPKHKQQAELIEWLLHFYGGGTTLDVPVHELPTNYWPQFMAAGAERGKTDVIMITDAVVNCDEEMRRAYLSWAAALQVKTYGIVIGGGEAGDFGDICTRSWAMPELGMNTEAIESILSI